MKTEWASSRRRSGSFELTFWKVPAFAGMTVLVCIFLAACSQSGGNVPVHNYGDCARKGSLGLHTIQRGETLWAVSQTYRVELRDLLDLNHLEPPYAMREGTRIRIPAPRTYEVRAGDTLYRVSRMFDTTTTDLARLNHLRGSYALNKGQVLRLPSQRRLPSVSVTPKNVSSEVASVAAIPSVSPVQSEALPPVGDTPSTEVVMKVPDQQKTISLPKTPQLSSSGFLAPVSGRVISSYGPKSDGLHNDGINIKAAKGTAIRAANNGTIVYVGDEIEGYGNMILIRHGGGYVTAYAHLEKIFVKKGEVIKRGQTIGTVGKSGHVSSPQLHFEIRKGKRALDPQTMIDI